MVLRGYVGAMFIREDDKVFASAIPREGYIYRYSSFPELKPTRNLLISLRVTYNTAALA